MTKYIVKDGHTLGYLLPSNLMIMGVLAGNVFMGGHDPKNGVVMLVDGIDKVRPATKADFEAFRVALPPDFKEEPASWVSVIESACNGNHGDFIERQMNHEH